MFCQWSCPVIHLFHDSTVVLCAGRLDRKIEFPLPNEDARANILRIHSRKMNVSSDVNYEELARSTDDFNGAQLKAVCVEAVSVHTYIHTCVVTWSIKNSVQRVWLLWEEGPQSWYMKTTWKVKQAWLPVVVDVHLLCLFSKCHSLFQVFWKCKQRKRLTWCIMPNYPSIVITSVNTNKTAIKKQARQSCGVVHYNYRDNTTYQNITSTTH